MKKLIIIYISFLLTPTVSFAEVTAPFGLEWGLSKRSITQRGVRLNSCENIAVGLEQCEASNLPKSVSFGETYRLIIDSERGLQKTQLFGEDIINDSYGTKGKRLYQQLKDSITAKYASSEYEHNSYEWSGRELYDESNEFYQCLNYDTSCGVWTTFVMGEGAVTIELKGLSKGKGWILLTHESRDWSDIYDNANSRKNESDFDAL